MAARKASGPECDCGQVVFDLSDKMPGDLLRCPWCRKRYRLGDDDSLTEEPVKPRASSSRKADPPRPSSRARMRPAPSGPLESEEPGYEEENDGQVEVFRYDSDDTDEKPKGGRREVPFSRQHTARSRDMAGDATVPLDRISRRRTRTQEPADDEAGDAFPDELPPIQPLNLEKWVVRMFLGMVPVGTVLFMAWIIYGVYEGERDFVTYRIFGLTIRGNNPWVWFGGIVLGGLAFLGLWVGYVYFFVHRKKLVEAEEKRRKEKDDPASSSRRANSTRRASRREPGTHRE